MIIDLPSTTTNAVGKRLVKLRDEGGAVALGRVLTLVVDVGTHDVEEAIAAAEAIGDDRLQQQAGGRVVPDSFTHGSSEQRVRWFMQGLKGGTVQGCDSFRASRL